MIEVSKAVNDMDKHSLAVMHLTLCQVFSVSKGGQGPEWKFNIMFSHSLLASSQLSVALPAV